MLSINSFNNLSNYFEFHASIRGDLLMASDKKKALNYAKAWTFTGNISAAIQKSGVKKGDRVGILAKNSVDNLCTFLACARIGVVAVGLNYRLSVDELEFISSDAELKILIFDSEFSELRGKYLQSIDGVCFDDSINNCQSFQQWVEVGCEPEYVDVSKEDTLFHMYTSGTTGRPKGVLISHGNVLTNSFQASLSSGFWLRAGERSLVIAPTFHAVGLVGSLLGVIYGSSMIILRDYDPLEMIEALAREKINSVAVIPVMLQFSMMMVPNIREYDLSALHTISYGGSPMAVSLLTECIDIFDCDFIQGYGQTEATMALTFLTAADHRKALLDEPGLLRSCGRVVAGSQLKIIDDNGNEIGFGQVGEILASGPQVMQGYWNNADATSKTVVDGWLHTGDAGYIDERGYVFIQDRVKDMIISGGENIYPVEIENVLMSNTSIEDVAVIGVPDEKWGEVPLAILVAGKHKELSSGELASFCEGKLAKFKIPRNVEYVEVLPRNPSGKILKKDLRVIYSDKYGI
jgi:acyl-CoA synthetase (AMP-forming)/AMP-acid ligase II